jgi:hypothetical protein
MDNAEGVKQVIKMYSVTKSYAGYKIPEWNDIQNKINDVL